MEAHGVREATVEEEGKQCRKEGKKERASTGMEPSEKEERKP